MKTNLYSVLFPVFIIACGPKEEPVVEPDTAAPVEPEDTAEPDELEEPQCASGDLEEGLFGFVGRMDLQEMDVVFVPEERTVAVFEVLSESDTFMDETTWFGFKINDGIEPLFTTESDADGCFSLDLPEGSYSVVTQFGDGWDCGGTIADCTVQIDGAVEQNFIWDNTVMY